jgi:hypothetical protein
MRNNTRRMRMVPPRQVYENMDGVEIPDNGWVPWYNLVQMGYAE